MPRRKRLGLLRGCIRVPPDFNALLPPTGVLAPPVSGEFAAQALTEPMRLLTKDVAIAGYGDIVTVV